MSLDPIMLDIAGFELSPEDEEILRHPAVGGVILFSRNYHSIEQIENLITHIHQLRDPHLLVAVDHEGGRVQRFHEGFTRLPAVRRIGELYDHNKKSAKSLAEKVGWLMAVELRSVGVDFSFAPVLDIDYQQCAVIGDRAFHSDPHAVYELAYAYIKGMESAGMASVAKHFPGHGAVTDDSHLAIPVDHRPLDTVMQNDVYPYRMLIKNNLTGVMPAHVIFEKIHSQPAGFSNYWLKNVLREQLEFNGVIFSDDIDMQGASFAGENYADRAHSAMLAGCDMILVCNNRQGAIDVLESLQNWNNPVTNMRLARMHGRKPITRTQLRMLAKWHETVDLVQRYVDEPTIDFRF